MAIPTWTTGQVLTASDVNTWLKPRGKIKEVNTTRTSTTTLTADPELFMAMEANSLYALQCMFETSSPTTADFKFDFTGPSGFDYRIVWHNSSTSGDAMGGLGDAPHAISSSGGNSSSTDDYITINGYVTTAATVANLGLRWAQVTFDAGNTVLKLGSWIRLVRMS